MKTISLVGALLAGMSAAIACDCDWAGSFTEMARDDVLVVVARVKEHRFVHVSKSSPDTADVHLPDAMLLEIMEVLKGTCAERELLVVGDDGYLCRPYVTEFPVGTEWALVLYREEEEVVISICGECWLKKENDRFSGVIEGKNRKRIRSISIDELRKKIRAVRPLPRDASTVSLLNTNPPTYRGCIPA